MAVIVMMAYLYSFTKEARGDTKTHSSPPIQEEEGIPYDIDPIILLEKFLMEKGLWYEYLFNCNVDELGFNDLNELNVYFKRPQSLTLWAFNWSDTSDPNLWAKIHNQWGAHLLDSSLEQTFTHYLANEKV